MYDMGIIAHLTTREDSRTFDSQYDRCENLTKRKPRKTSLQISLPPTQLNLQKNLGLIHSNNLNQNEVNT